MNIEEMIELEELEGMKIIAGKNGTNREVMTVSVMDAPDIYNWIKGGEFLITTAFVMRNNPLELKDLISQKMNLIIICFIGTILILLGLMFLGMFLFLILYGRNLFKFMQ